MYIVLTMVHRSQEGLSKWKKSRKGFSLIEMITVVMIVGVLVGLTGPSLVSLMGATQFTRSVTTLSGVVEFARQYATTQNTYVWVALWEDDVYMPGEGNICYAVIASSDGQSGAYDADGNSIWNDLTAPAIDPFSETIGMAAGTDNTNLQYQVIRKPDYISRVKLVKSGDDLVRDKTTLGVLEGGAVRDLTNAPSFSLKVPYGKDKQVFDKIFTFTPSGEAKVDEEIATAIEFGIVRKNQKNPDCALFRVNGPTGSLKVGRK